MVALSYGHRVHPARSRRQWQCCCQLHGREHLHDSAAHVEHHEAHLLPCSARVLSSLDGEHTRRLLTSTVRGHETVRSLGTYPMLTSELLVRCSLGS